MTATANRLSRSRKAKSFQTQLALLTLSGMLSGGTLSAEASAMPRIPRPRHHQTTLALAHQLASWDQRQKLAAGKCNRDMAEARQSPSETGLYDLTYKVLLETANVFTVQVDLTIYCGGAHPDFVHGEVTFDARTGRHMDSGRFSRVL